MIYILIFVKIIFKKLAILFEAKYRVKRAHLQRLFICIKVNSLRRQYLAKHGVSTKFGLKNFSKVYIRNIKLVCTIAG